MNKNQWPCWSCKEPVTMKMRADADGNCPHCSAELDIEDWPFADEPVCCTPSAEDLQLLAEGSYTPEELWGGSRPTCPKCIDK